MRDDALFMCNAWYCCFNPNTIFSVVFRDELAFAEEERAFGYEQAAHLKV